MADPSFEDTTRGQTQVTGQQQQEDPIVRQETIRRPEPVQRPQLSVQTQGIADNRSEDSYYADAETCVERNSPGGNSAGPPGMAMPPPLAMDEKKQPVDAGINIPPPPPVDVESQASFPPKPPYWKRLIKNKTFQMIAAALLAVTIGLIVAGTVDKVPDEAKAFLALPGYMWLRAVKAAGKFQAFYPSIRVLIADAQVKSCP